MHAAMRDVLRDTGEFQSRTSHQLLQSASFWL